MHENDISYLIRGSIFEVYNYFGPGLLESVYQKALSESLLMKGCKVKYELPIEVSYYDTKLGLGFRADIVVNGKVIVEVKSVETVMDVHYKQLLTYLKLTDTRLGLLVNFNSNDIASNITRVVNNL
jgi:GxxExxY protein